MDDERTDDGTVDARQVPGERRPERQLDRPPSDRYVDPVPGPAEQAPTSGRWGTAGAILAALIGALAIAVGGGKLTITAGLLVIAAVLGWVVAGLVSMDADPGSGRTRRRGVAAAVAVAGVALGQAGLWVIGRQEGGTLGLVDYLAEVFGFLVPLELALAAVIAWWRTA